MLPGVGRARVLADMDAWGYTFRLGSAAAYFERDADAAWAWLVERGLVAADRTLRLPGWASCGVARAAPPGIALPDADSGPPRRPQGERHPGAARPARPEPPPPAHRKSAV